MSAISSAVLCSIDRTSGAKGKTSALLLAIWIVAWSLIFSLPAGAAKKEKRAIPVPPMAVPAQAQVTRGKAVEIPLRVYGDPGRSVKFEIRRPPAHGRISAPEEAYGDTASVVYQSAEGSSYSSDSFSFVAKSTRGVSAPVDVKIRIVDPESVLVTPEELDFGRVTLGEPAERILTIANRGGGVAEGAIMLPDGWEAEGGSRYRLPEDETASFTLRFTGKEERVYRGSVRYSSHPTRETELSATASAPFGFQPKAVELRFDRERGKRTGVLEIANRGDSPRVVQIERSERVIAPENVEIAAHGKATILIETAPGDVNPLDEKVLVISGGYLGEVPVRAGATGPVLRTDKREASFGEVEMENAQRVAIEVENAGGTRAFVTASVPPPFKVEAEDASFSVEPGKSRKVSVGIQAAESGAFRTTLSLKTENEELLVPIDVHVKERRRVSASQSAGLREVTPAALGAGSEDSLAQAEMAASSPARAGNPNIPAVGRVKVRRIGMNSCDLAFLAPGASVTRYQIESRLLSLDANKELKIDWVPVTTVTFTSSSNEVVASIRRLEPNTPYTFQVSSVDAAGEFSRPSNPITVRTVKPPAIFTPLRVLFLVLVVLVFLIWRQRRIENSPLPAALPITPPAPTAKNYLD